MDLPGLYREFGGPGRWELAAAALWPPFLNCAVPLMSGDAPGPSREHMYTHLPYTHLSLTEYIKLRTVFRCGYCTCLFSNLFVWRAVLQLYFSWNSCWCCRLPEDGGSLSVEGVSLLL